jgi:hypothetical protein
MYCGVIAVAMQRPRKGTCCSVTPGKHVSNSRVIARQVFSKRVPTSTDTHVTVEVVLEYKMKTVFSMWFVPKCYKKDNPLVREDAHKNRAVIVKDK